MTMKTKARTRRPESVVLLLALEVTCSRPSSAPASIGSEVSGEVEPAKTVSSPDASLAASGAPQVHRAADTYDERTISFTWMPSSASARDYATPDQRDRQKILLLRGIERGKSYPVVVAMHGQPRRGQAPRDYGFIRVVSDVARELVAGGSTPPFILVTPVFRFSGQNWPDFDFRPFMDQVEQLLQQQAVLVDGTYVFGHSGAAGCGGAGLNRIAAFSPAAVGFFDTCVGAGFRQAVGDLSRQHVPTLIAHSVETAGFQPRQPLEYDAKFDFGRVYSRMGLHPGPCPSSLPEVPLRELAYRCASNDSGTTLALVLDTGVGEKAHEALVPVAMRYFIRHFVKWPDR